MNLFYGKIQRGKINLYEKVKFAQLVKKLEGKLIDLAIEPYKEIRTLSQNKYYWGVVLAELSDFTGFTDEELHLFFKKKFLPTKKMKLGKYSTEIPQSSTQLSTKEFVDYVDRARQFAQEELDCFIPLPGDMAEFYEVPLN